MIRLINSPARAAGLIFMASALALAQSEPARQPEGGYAQPGTVNYVEGQVTLDGQSIARNQVGSTVAEPGHVLQTANGKAEMLLTPGVFVRLGDHSAVKMISASLSDTRIELTAGRVMVETAEVEKENHIVVTDAGTDTRLVKHGIYEFSVNPAWGRVYDGKAEVQWDGRSNNMYKGEQIAFNSNNPKLKTRGFSVKQTEASDNLYAWSKLRADYSAQANMSAAEMYYAGGPGWYGTGWYWDPYFDSYAWLLADGFLWDPFGFGYFSPGYWGVYAPYFGYGRFGYGYGYALGRPGYGRGSAGLPGGAIARGSARAAVIGGGGIGARGGFGGAGAMRGGFGGAAAMRGGFGGGMHGGFGGRR